MIIWKTKNNIVDQNKESVKDKIINTLKDTDAQPKEAHRSRNFL